MTNSSGYPHSPCHPTMHYLLPAMTGITLRVMERVVTHMPTNENRSEATDLAAVHTPDDDSLPSIDPERYGAFTTRNDETILYDSDAKGAWIRADHSVELGR